MNNTLMKKNKKTIGVITMHRVINHGSFLQAYATQKTIEKLGYVCEIIDYIFPNSWHYEKGLKKSNSLKSKIVKLTTSLGLTSGQRKKNRINNAIEKYLNLSKNSYQTPDEILKTPPEYDIYVTGSDQTWNPKHTFGDETFLLDFAGQNAKKVSFSASLAGKNMNEVYKEIFKRNLTQYRHISIRDKNGNIIINELLGKNAHLTLDPTMVLNKKEWSDFGKEKTNVFATEKYIVFYLITHSFDATPYIYEILKELQEKTNFKVYSFTEIPAQYNINYASCADMGVEAFIHLFETASYVVTSSFHGTAFATNFGIPLYSVVPAINNEDDRQGSLLKQLDIENCLVPIGKPFETINPNYDIEKEQHLLDILREDTILFLKNAFES